MDNTIFLEKISKQIHDNPDLPAITLDKVTITYKQLGVMVTSVQHHIEERGLKRPERFLFAAKPTPENIAVILGFLSYGIALTFLDPNVGDNLFASRAKKVKAEYAIIDPFVDFLGSSRYGRTLQRFLPHVQLVDMKKYVNTAYTLGSRAWLSPCESLNEWTKQTGDGFPDIQIEPADDAIIVFTSGTTAEPKGVIQTFQSLSANVEGMADVFGMKAGDRVFSEPMTLGLVALSVGAEWVIPHGSEYSPDADVFFSVPTDLTRNLDYYEKHPERTPRVSHLGVGAAPVLTSLIKRARRVFGVVNPELKMWGVYGMTEMLPIAVVDCFERKLSYSGDGDLVGKPLGDTQVEIAEDNEVIVSGSGLCKGYLGMEEHFTLATGDLGVINENGELVLLGRKKDMFIRGHMNIYPSLYENALSKVTGVAELALVGVPDYYEDDYIILMVEALKTANKTTLKKELEKAIIQTMDKDAQPDKILFMDSLPKKGRANKLDRATATEKARKCLNQSS